MYFWLSFIPFLLVSLSLFLPTLVSSTWHTKTLPDYQVLPRSDIRCLLLHSLVRLFWKKISFLWFLCDGAELCKEVVPTFASIQVFIVRWKGDQFTFPLFFISEWQYYCSLLVQLCNCCQKHRLKNSEVLFSLCFWQFLHFTFHLSTITYFQWLRWWSSLMFLATVFFTGGQAASWEMLSSECLTILQSLTTRLRGDSAAPTPSTTETTSTPASKKPCFPADFMLWRMRNMYGMLPGCLFPLSLGQFFFLSPFFSAIIECTNNVPAPSLVSNSSKADSWNGWLLRIFSGKHAHLQSNNETFFGQRQL